MSWITERLEAKKKAAEAERQRIRAAAEEDHRLTNLAPNVWHDLGDAIQQDVEEFNATGGRRVIVRRTEQRIEVAWDGDLANLVAIDFDHRNSKITYVCPNPAPNTGHPRRGEYRVVLDQNEQPILFGETLRGVAPVDRVEPQEASEAILGPILLPL